MSEPIFNLFSVKQFAERYSAFSPAALRSYILNSADRLGSNGQIIKGNGLENSGAIIRIGRRVLIDEPAFFSWIAEQQKQRKTRAA